MIRGGADRHDDPGHDWEAGIDADAEPGGSPLDRLAATRTERRWRRAGWLVSALIVAFVVWAGVARLDEVSIATGEVVPQGNVKVIQHLEGGIIRSIAVEEGEQVERGDLLLSLDLGAGGLNPHELRVQLDSLELKRARLQAEATGTDPQWPERIVEARPEMLEAEKQVFASHRAERRSTVSVLEEQVEQRDLAVQELKARRVSVEAELALARELLGMSGRLLAEGLQARMEHVSHRRDVSRLEGEIAGLDTAVPRAEAALEEARARLLEERQRIARESYEKLSDVEVSIARTQELLIRADDQVRRTEIRSPIAGEVKNIRFNTLGGVVGAGEPIMEIVPSNDTLVVEARLSPVDRGYVREGQKATVKLSTYEFVRYGGLDGEVARIAADTSLDQKSGEAYYSVVVHTRRATLGENELPISPGMQATVDIHTGSRTAIDYLLRPVLKLSHEAFRER